MIAVGYPEYRDTEIHWLGNVPAHWEVRKIKFVADVLTSNVDKHIKENESPVRLCNYVDVYYNDRITNDLNFMEGTALPKETEKFSLIHSDVVVTKDSESWDDIAVPAFVSEDLRGVICGYHLAIMRTYSNIFDGQYLFYLLCSDVLNYQFKVAANGVTRFSLPTFALENALVLLPPIDEQHAICRFLDQETRRIDALINLLGVSDTADTAPPHSLTGLLTEYRSALITNTVTGKIDVRGEAAIEGAKNIITLNSKRKTSDAFKRTVLAAEILSCIGDHMTFGRTKFQKILHLSERHLEIREIAGNYHRHAAGPHDYGMMKSVESQLKKQGWFEAIQDAKGRPVIYRRMKNVGGHAKYFDRYWKDRHAKIHEFLDLFRKMNTEQCEIVSTLFAAWNDLLIDGRVPNDEDIVAEIIRHWPEEKRQIAERRWYAAINWMRAHEIVPRGIGVHTKGGGSE